MDSKAVVTSHASISVIGRAPHHTLLKMRYTTRQSASTYCLQANLTSYISACTSCHQHTPRRLMGHGDTAAALVTNRFCLFYRIMHVQQAGTLHQYLGLCFVNLKKERHHASTFFEA
jgi:hypothetical protein